MEEQKVKNTFSRANTTIGNAEVNYDIRIKKGFDALLGDQEIMSFEFDDKAQTITVVFRKRNNEILTVNPPRPAPDKIWKEIYGIKEGKLALLSKLEGKHTPAYSVDEKIEFKDESQG